MHFKNKKIKKIKEIKKISFEEDLYQDNFLYPRVVFDNSQEIFHYQEIDKSSKLLNKHSNIFLEIELILDKILLNISKINFKLLLNNFNEYIQTCK